MNLAPHSGASEPSHDERRIEPRRMTLADLIAIVAGVALVLTIPSRTSGWPPFMAPPPILYLVVIGGLRLAAEFGLVLALVVLLRRGRYGGPVRPAEWLALGLASSGLLGSVPNLDDAVNAYYAAVGSAALDFGVARWLLSAPAALGVVPIAAGLVLLRRRTRDGSRVASALSVVGIVVGFFLWFWGPCEAARLQLAELVVPELSGDPSSWGWRLPAVQAIREVVANGPTALTWGLPVAAAVRSWRADRGGRARAWVWTERAAFADAVAAALLLLTAVAMQGTADLVRGVSWVATVAGVGLVSWWITGRLGLGRHPAPSSAG